MPKHSSSRPEWLRKLLNIWSKKNLGCFARFTSANSEKVDLKSELEQMKENIEKYSDYFKGISAEGAQLI